MSDFVNKNWFLRKSSLRLTYPFSSRTIIKTTIKIDLASKRPARRAAMAEGHAGNYVPRNPSFPERVVTVSKRMIDREERSDERSIRLGDTGTTSEGKGGVEGERSSPTTEQHKHRKVSLRT